MTPRALVRLAARLALTLVALLAASHTDAQTRDKVPHIGYLWLGAPSSDKATMIMPSARRFGVISDPATSGPAGLQAIASAAGALGVELQTVEVRSPREFPAAVASLGATGIEGVSVLGSPLLFSAHKELVELLLAEKLPRICEWREMAATGCLASYGTTTRETVAMVAALVDKILKGANPADTPAQQSTKFELVIDYKTAKALGLTIPPSVLARADEVIE